MGRLQIVGIAVVFVLVTGFGWLHEHDKRITAQALNDQRADELALDAKQIEGFRISLVKFNQEYTKQSLIYANRGKIVADSTKKLKATIDTLLSKIEASLPDSTKHLATDVEEACHEQANMIESQLILCDSLRRQSELQVTRRDTLIFALQRSRDGYKDLYESEKKVSRSYTGWSTIGKMSTGAIVVGAVTKFFGLW